MSYRWLLLCTACLVSSNVFGARGSVSAPLLLRDPTLSATQMAFSYAGNIWITRRDGSGPRRLTNGGHEAKPAFSPDGSQVAYVGGDGGARAVYVVPASGGEPRRLTYHPADLGIGPVPDALGWTPDGRSILFNSRRATFFWHTVQSFAVQPFAVQLFTVPAEGGFATPLPLDVAVQGSFSPDGSHLAYVPNEQRQVGWKRYRGGQTTAIWIASLVDSSIEARIPRDNSNDFNPLWVGDHIYFLSDRNGPVTLFAYDTKTREVRELVKSAGLDIKSASVSDDTVVYEQFGSIHLFDLKSGENHAVKIQLPAGSAEVHPHDKDLDRAQFHDGVLSPGGDRAAFGVRGEVFTVPVEHGDVRNLTHTADVVERDPAWSPDGHYIAYFSDESGEYALHIRDPSGRGKVKKLQLGTPPGFFYAPSWSPDSHKIAYTDQRLNYWYIDLKTQTPVRLDTDLYVDPGHGLQMAWSPDSRWIAYTRQLANHLHAVFVYSLERARSYPVTDGRSDALFVAFDNSGKYLYFTASTDVASGAAWVDMTGFQRPVTRAVYLVLLNEALPSPLNPHGNEEPGGGQAEIGHRYNAENGKAARVEIEPEHIGQRILSLPIPSRNYYGLMAGKTGVIYLIQAPTLNPLPSVSSAANGIPTQVLEFDLETRKTEQVLGDVDSYGLFKHVSTFNLSAGGGNMLYSRRGQWFTARAERSATRSPAGSSEHRLELDHVQVHIDPRAEWKHMYDQVWRNELEFFYDPGLHGIDVAKIKQQYQPYLKNISTREDLNYLFNEMLGNLTVGHMNAVGGDILAADGPKTGLLGADYAVENGHYRFTRIYAGDPWDSEVRAPLAQPGSEARIGDYLLAVNGRDVRPMADVYSYFQGTAGRTVVLTVSSKADTSEAHVITVVPLEDETALRNQAWVEENRRKVDELSSGRVAYIYLPDTLGRGYERFNRDFFSQVGKDAAIVDERYNDGGAIADYFIDYLRRPLLNYWHMRYGQDTAEPQEAIFGPKVLLINEITGSGGDYLAWAFRAAGIGPLIGQRTWGGLVGSYANPADLLDGGIVSTPNFAFYNPNGAWDIENHGVQPDIDVEQDPKAVREGHDPQLERAVAVVMERLRANPPRRAPSHPPYPNYGHAVQ